MCSSKNNHYNRIWFVLDELAYFDQAIPNLKDGLTMSRSFGGAFVLGVQDLSSLSKIYGHDLSRVIANNCRNKMIMNIDDSYTAKWCSDLFGDGELIEWQEGLSYGSHEMRDGVNSHMSNRIKRAILPSEFSKLDTGSGYIKMPGFNPALINFKSSTLSRKADSFIEKQDIKQQFQQEIVSVEKQRKEVAKIVSTSLDAVSKNVDDKQEKNKDDNNQVQKQKTISDINQIEEPQF
jgi:type IV secretory pathway TraG/TraD family ATPase VirD4